MNKYNAKKRIVDGLEFDSIAESRRYELLKSMLDNGEIEDLVLQPVFLIQKGFTYKGKKERKIEYIADFQYKENGKTIVEDVKGFKTAIYKLKRKMLLFNYPDINFYEI